MAAYRYTTVRYRPRRRHAGGGGRGMVAVVALAGAGLGVSQAHAAHAAASPPAASKPAAGHALVTKIQIPAAAAKAIAYARARLGLPYVWGGTGPGGYDCSGLVMEAYASAGVYIARTSQEQWATLPHVTSLRPGDLIFYAGSDGTVGSPGHVVLYIGGGRVIQAYATGYPVMVSLLSSMDAGALTGYARPGGAS